MGHFFRHDKGENIIVRRQSVKSLIINAEDVGISGAVDEAVDKCYREGAITGASVMACGRRFQEAVYMLKNLGRTEVGVHLTLTGNFLPCTEESFLINTLLQKNGKFVPGYKDLALRLFFGRLELEQVYLELSHQVKRIKKEGLNLTHLDSHEHVHLFPDILKVALRIAVEFAIPYIRIPIEDPKIIWRQFSVKDYVRHMALNTVSKRTKDRVDFINTKCNDDFLGHFHSGRLADDILCYMMDNLKDGVTELAFHPSVESEEFLQEFPWYSNGPNEFDLLLNGEWKKRLDTHDIKLISHKEAIEHL
jgi:predicted glycoside hydrolase/deacetylase ChbG (UPF0249 family)